MQKFSLALPFAICLLVSGASAEAEQETSRLGLCAEVVVKTQTIEITWINQGSTAFLLNLGSLLGPRDFISSGLAMYIMFLRLIS